MSCGVLCGCSRSLVFSFGLAVEPFFDDEG